MSDYNPDPNPQPTPNPAPLVQGVTDSEPITIEDSLPRSDDEARDPDADDVADTARYVETDPPEGYVPPRQD